MVTNDLDRFNELAESCGNRYLAVRFVSMWTRALGQEYKDYQIAESKLIEWVITGKCPYIESQLAARRIIHDDDHLSDFLEWVIDDEVADEVRDLYRLSIKHRHLIYCKRSDFNPSRISRTNILLRMIWYSTSIKEGE